MRSWIGNMKGNIASWSEVMKEGGMTAFWSCLTLIVSLHHGTNDDSLPIVVGNQGQMEQPWNHEIKSRGLFMLAAWSENLIFFNDYDNLV